MAKKSMIANQSEYRSIRLGITTAAAAVGVPMATIASSVCAVSVFANLLTEANFPA